MREVVMKGQRQDGKRLLRLTDSSGALVLRHENRAKSLTLGNRQVLEWVSNSGWTEATRSADRNSSGTQAAAAGGLAKGPQPGLDSTKRSGHRPEAPQPRGKLAAIAPQQLC
jgi:hypothetical protein